MFLIESCAKQQIKINYLSEERAQLLKWQQAKAWKTCLAWL